MNFKIIKIKKRGLGYKLRKYLKHKLKKKKTHKQLISLLICFFVIIGGINAFYKYSFESFIFKSISNNLPTDDSNYTNILIVGMGGVGHDGQDLTDTIILAGINSKKSNGYLLSIPRDLYINHPDIIPQRVNSIFANYEPKLGETKAFDLLKSSIENITNVPIHYHIGVNFEAVTDVVDALGGVDIYNENLIYDPFYPGPNYTFETFTLKQGPVTLNGSTALKFIRSRKTTSDYDRSRRQQQLIAALKDKAQSKEILTNPLKLKSLYNALMSNIKTNIQVEDILFLASTLKNFDIGKLQNLVIHDDPTNKGGFLFVPPKSEYNQAFVLLPIDPKYSYIQKYLEIHKKYTNTMSYHGKIVVKNGTDIPGFARKVASHLERLGFEISEISNAESNQVKESRVDYYNLTQQKVIEAIKQTTLINKVNELPVENPDVPILSEIVIGMDLKPYYDYFTPIEKLENLILQGQKEWYQSPLEVTSDESKIDRTVNLNPLQITSE